MSILPWLAAGLFALMFALACFAYWRARETAKWGLLMLLLLMGAGYFAPLWAKPHHTPWCGLWMQRHTGIHGPGNLARAIEWRHVGREAYGPGPGVIGVMPHHVFQVVAVLEHGLVLAISGNDGNAVRTRPRSTAGVVAWRAL